MAHREDLAGRSPVRFYHDKSCFDYAAHPDTALAWGTRLGV